MINYLDLYHREIPSEAGTEECSGREKLLAEYLEPEKEINDEKSPVPKLLRWVGGITLLISASVFLAQSYLSLSGVGKFYSFLAFLGILGGSGFICLKNLEDKKGARTFVGLACALLPVLFLQMGGLVYSLVGADVSQVPSIFQLKIDGPLSLAVAVLLATVPVYLISKFCFSVFDKSSSSNLTTHYLLLNVSLLLPFRGELFTGLCSVIGLVLVTKLFMEIKDKAEVFELSASRLMFIVPAFAVLVRSWVNYGWSVSMAAQFFFILAALFFFLLPVLSRSESLTKFMVFLSLPCWFAAVVNLFELLPFGGNSEKIAVLMSCVLVQVLGFYHGKMGGILRAVLSPFSLVVVWLVAVGSPSEVEVIGTLLLGMTSFLFGLYDRSRWSLYLSLASLGLSIIAIYDYLDRFNLLDPWLVLAAIGVAVIFLSSVLETRKEIIRSLVAKLESRFSPEGSELVERA